MLRIKLHQKVNITCKFLRLQGPQPQQPQDIGNHQGTALVKINGDPHTRQADGTGLDGLSRIFLVHTTCKSVNFIRVNLLLTFLFKQFNIQLIN